MTSRKIHILLKAAELLRDENCEFHLKIIGSGPEDSELRSRVGARLENHVEFTGHLPEDKLKVALSDVSTVVMPSLGGEVFGLVAAENMLRGKLLIVSDIGALKEVVGDTGLVFPTADADKLAACMRQVVPKADDSFFSGRGSPQTRDPGFRLG